ncbi:hypothetical protein F2Q70_00002951 [Brassica cretica]|uniref:Uncharacterized protein n=1 Tax=Brassica cretica TaxID=69181 RepID=A0A8S9ILQ0_BRACR|nr:hypothetical protein F2Q70_00002951 [Brassica cretica]
MEWINSKRNWKHDVKYFSMMGIEDIINTSSQKCGTLENVNEAGEQVMDSLGLVRDIPVLITDRVMRADLIVDHRQGNACGSDCCPP